MENWKKWLLCFFRKGSDNPLNIILEQLRYLSVLIIGIVLVIWYRRRKGWGHNYRASLLFIFTWRTIMLFIILSMNLLFDLYLIDILRDFRIAIYFYIHPIMVVVVSLLINGFLGIKIFKLSYKQDIHESLYIILTIVFVDLVLERIFFYSTITIW